MIYFISDPHGGERMQGFERALRLAQPDDTLIILGDLGLAFGKSEENRRFTEWFLSLDRRILIVDGNHENFAYLNAFPEESWGGGRVNRLSRSILRLQRGYVFEIDGQRFFVMGGCKSSAKWAKMGLWYEGEEPSEEEIARAYRSLSESNHAVDYVLTHKYEPSETEHARNTLEGLRNYIDESVSFRRWYAGHWHAFRDVDERHTVVYDFPTALGQTAEDAKAAFSNFFEETPT